MKPIRYEETDTIEPRRLERALDLLGGVERIAPGEYRVWRAKRVGRELVRSARNVNLHLDLPCDCEDNDYRGRTTRGNCKHVLAARMAEGDLGVLGMVGPVLLRRQRIQEEADRITRRERA